MLYGTVVSLLFVVFVSGGAWFLMRSAPQPLSPTLETMDLTAKTTNEQGSITSPYGQGLDSTNTVVTATLICTHPVFTEELRLVRTIDGTSERTSYVADAINYLRQKYCRTITEKLSYSEAVPLGDDCTQYSGPFRGETVYWGQCAENSNYFKVLH